MADWTRLETLHLSYLEGDAAAARGLFGELSKVIQAYFRVRLSSAQDAEELAQAALLKIHFSRDRYDRHHRLKTWVFTIASRTLIDHWRGAAVEQEVLARAPQPQEGEESAPAGWEAHASEVLDPARKTELNRDLNQALQTLKPIERQIVYLYGVEGLSMAEIGQALGITEGAAKLRAHRAYLELRKILAVVSLIIAWMERPWT